MSEQELLEDFIRHGNGYYPEDKARFLRWALVAYRNGSEYPAKELGKRGLSRIAVEYYRTAYEFVGLTADAVLVQ